MTFQELHENLRLEIANRIKRGSLTRTGLARQAGFRQAHISNFLNKKRSLSLEGLDRVLAAQGLSIEQMLPLELQGASPEQPAPVFEPVPVVSPSAAMDAARIPREAEIETLQIAASRLDDNRPRASARHSDWQRFVAVRADAQQSAAMEPLISPGALVVIDRHYNSLAPYRAQQRTLYAIRSGAALAIRFLEYDEGKLILRPLSHEFPIQLLGLGAHESPADYIVGRVCLVMAEF